MCRSRTHIVYYTSVDCNPITPLLRFVLELVPTVVQQLTKFWLTFASRGPSAVAELLVYRIVEPLIVLNEPIVLMPPCSLLAALTVHYCALRLRQLKQLLIFLQIFYFSHASSNIVLHSFYAWKLLAPKTCVHCTVYCVWRPTAQFTEAVRYNV